MSLTSAAEAERHADQLRRELAGTLDDIVDNLAPRRLASEAVAAARERTPEWLKRYWAFAQSPAGLAIIGGAAAVGLAGSLAATRYRTPKLRRR
jgi:anti-sigma factor RsiW